MLGLRSGRNILVAPDPAWSRAFDDELQRLAPALLGLALGIEHYGSTAVAGLKAKPIIDILVGVDSIAVWRSCENRLLPLGYAHFADAGVEGHFVFTRGRTADDRTHLLHVVAFQSPQWHLNLAFRDELRRNAQLRSAYAAEKERAAAQAPTDRVAYNALKSSFIRGVMAGLTPKTDLP